MRQFIVTALAFALFASPLSASALSAEEILLGLSELRDSIADAQSQLAAASSAKRLKTRPRVSRDPLPAALHSLGAVTLIRFKVAAHERGDVGLGKVTHSVSAHGLIVSNDRMYGYTNPSYTTPIPGLVDGLIPQIGSSFASPIQIPAGATYYFKIMADVRASSTKGSIITHILGDTAPSSFLTFPEQERTFARFIWSPNSTSTATYAMRDWLTGFDAGMRNNLSQRLQYVGPRPIVVHSPNGGEIWVAAPRVTDTISGYERYKRDIKWGGVPDSAGHDGKVLAYLEDTNGRTVGRIPAFAYGSIAWVVGVVNPNPNCGSNTDCINNGLVVVPAGKYYVRLVDTQTDTTDKSDAPFSITAPRSPLCAGPIPIHALLCPGDSQGLTEDTLRTLNVACSAPTGSSPKCQYVCASGYEKRGNECVPAGPAFQCVGTIPVGSVLCRGDAQGLQADTRRSLARACSLPAGSSPKCQYICGTGFTYEGGGCVAASNQETSDIGDSPDVASAAAVWGW